MIEPVRNPEQLPPLPESAALRDAILDMDLGPSALLAMLDRVDARVAELQRDAKAYRDLVALATDCAPVMVWSPDANAPYWIVDNATGHDLAAALAAAADRGRA